MGCHLSRTVALGAGALPLLLSSALYAAPVPASQNATGTTTVLRPLSVVKSADLDFAGLIVAGAGTATLDPTTGAVSVTGLLTRAGTGAHPARFTTTGSRNSVVQIRLPNQPVTLTRVGGTETIMLTNFTTDGPTNRKFAISQTFDFAVGGQITIAAGQAEGTYLGTFTVDVHYP